MMSFLRCAWHGQQLDNESTLIGSFLLDFLREEKKDDVLEKKIYSNFYFYFYFYLVNVGFIWKI